MLLYFCLKGSEQNGHEDLDVDVKSFLDQHKEKLDLFGVNKIDVDRDELWQDSVATFKHPKFQIRSPPRIRFLGEAAIDGGGPSREYGTLLLQTLFSSEAKLFEGKEDRKLPIYSTEGILSNMFKLAGKMVSYLLIHLDIGIQCFPESVYQYLASGDSDTCTDLCTLDDLCDYELMELIGEVSKHCNHL